MSLLRVAEGRKVYIICGRCDMRKGIDGLCSIVKTQYNLDPCTNTLFLFCGRRSDRFKAVFFDADRGFILLYVRLESGRFQWPTPEEAKQISLEQYKRLLDGLQVIEKSTLGKVDTANLLKSI